MYKKLLLICFISSTLLIAKDISKEDILKASIVKLINITDKLEKRVLVLENELLQKQANQINSEKIIYLPNARKYKGIHVETSLFFIPKNRSFIRVLPYPEANKISIATSNNEYKITELACYKEIGFWGKTQLGWIYISNSKYGKLVNGNGAPLSNSYNYWCNK